MTHTPSVRSPAWLIRASPCAKSPRPWASAGKRPAHLAPIPPPQRPLIPRRSQLAPFLDARARLLESAPKVSAAVIRPRLHAQGLAGGIPMVRDDGPGVRGATHKPQPVIRFASAPGVPCQLDWGPFGARADGDTQRKLSGVGVIAGQSRLRSRECTQSQRQETLPRCLLHACHVFQGTPQELVPDHLLTAVLERQGPLVRFHAHF